MFIFRGKKKKHLVIFSSLSDKICTKISFQKRRNNIKEKKKKHLCEQQKSLLQRGPFLLSPGWIGGHPQDSRLWGPLGSPTSAPTPFILLDLGARVQLSALTPLPRTSPLDPAIVPLVDLCYSTFQQGDLEKTPLALRRAPRLTFSRSRRRSFSVGGTMGRSALQGQFMALSGARAPRLTPPAAPGSGIVPSLGYRERRKGWRPFPTIGDNVRPQTCHTRRRGDMERMCPRVGAGHSAFPREEGKK